MKAVLVVDMPEDCSECELKAIDGTSYICSATDEPIYSISCPLRPLPQKIVGKQAKYIPAYSLGWNECIDEITGETE